MSAQDGSSNSTQGTTTNSPRRKHRGWIVAAAIIGTALLLAGGEALVHAKGSGWHAWRGGDISAEEIADRIALRVKYALKDVDATDEQRAQVTTILQAAAADVHSLASGHSGTHKQLHEILVADTIDRARLEAVRAEGMSVADQASKRILQAVADAAEVLTPEQRAKLAANMEKRRHHWHDDEE